jgi:hypothetical protein
MYFMIPLFFLNLHFVQIIFDISSRNSQVINTVLAQDFGSGLSALLGRPLACAKVCVTLSFSIFATINTSLPSLTSSWFSSIKFISLHLDNVLTNPAQRGAHDDMRARGQLKLWRCINLRQSILT